MIRRLLRLLQGEEGQGLAEYALILSLIAIVAVASLLLLGRVLTGMLSSIGTGVAGTI
jgi:pilus assembly protein Flp/PilA